MKKIISEKVILSRLYSMLLLLLNVGAIPANAQTEFEQLISDLGLETNKTDWSSVKKVSFPEPNCAYINVTGIAGMPTTKTQDLQAMMEFYDGGGNYFRKHVILNAQGSSSMGFVKKNIAVDLMEDEWIGDVETKITIGGWVTQSSFHLKAYYIDYFRGIATVGYKLYHQIATDRGLLWTRANLAKPNEQARCYPDGFPVIVYLNGSFYGVFSWQLKKHRDNYNMKKDVATQIHLDGVLRDNTIWHGSIDWTQFEVRNPKSLYTMNGDEYDGDHPLELIDETSEYYDLATDDDKVKAAKQRTAEVKASIVSLSRIYDELSELEANGATSDIMRQNIESHFDIEGLIDYFCFYFATAHHDGFGKNWQWITWDGVKWFCCPYDLDCTFGYFFTGGVSIPANFTGSGSNYKSYPQTGPAYWITKYYREDVMSRYQDLREKQILSAENMKSLVRNWYYRVGNGNYSKEWEHWPDSPCIGEINTNENWSTIDDRTEYSKLSDYDPNVTYEAGDKCRLDYRVWVATGTTTGVKPYSGLLGYHDSLERIENWIDTRTALEDDYLGYNSSDNTVSYTLQISNAEWATVCVPFAFDIPEGIKVYTITGIQGENIWLEKEEVVTKTEANKPYLINGAPGFYRLSGIPEDTDETDEENYLVNRLMKGTYTTTTAPEGSYVLQNQNGNLGFYPVGSDNITVPSNRAWLLLPPSKAPRMALLFDEGTTAIRSIETSKETNKSVIYDLNGNQISHKKKGFNILRNENGTITKEIVR